MKPRLVELVNEEELARYDVRGHSDDEPPSLGGPRHVVTAVDHETGTITASVETSRAYEMGVTAGRNGASDNDAMLYEVAVNCLGGVLDETAPDHVREKSGDYLLGFVAGWEQLMAVQPMFPLTRQQTARVNSLPRRVRLAWMSEYKRGMRRWQRAGGALSGKRPVLPEIP